MALEDIIINLTVGHLVWGTTWAPRIDKCQLRRNYFYILQNCSAPHVGKLPGLWLSAAQLQLTPKCQEMVQSSSTPPMEGLLCLLDLQMFSSLYVLQQLHNTRKYHMFHTPPQDLVAAQNSFHMLYSEKSVTGEQGLHSCHSSVNVCRYLQSLLNCFSFWQYGKNYFSPQILHTLAWKSQWNHWHL